MAESDQAGGSDPLGQISDLLGKSNVLDRLENSKNARKIDGIELQTRF